MTLGHAFPVEVISKDVDSVGARQINEPPPVQIGHGDSIARLDETSQFEVVAEVAAEREGNPITPGDINFLVTNRIPRRLATLWMGWFAGVRSPLLTRWSIAVWRLFTDLDLSEARDTRFESLRDCFTRELRPGARPIDPCQSLMVSPCDGIVGACGKVEGNRLFQAKGFPYTLADLFGNEDAAAPYQDGCYATLRLTSSMYHRFHAPAAGRVKHVTYISGDTWNVNPIGMQFPQ